jgi:spermidine synthase
MFHDRILWQGDSEYAHYEVVEERYNHRPSRVLFSGKREAVQSGVALDDDPELLFDYNQRFLELCQNLKPERVLLIGGGAMTFPTALLKALADVRMDVVERDQLLLQIATDYFDFVPSARLNLFHADGRTFLEHVVDPYEVLLIDAFSHLQVPRVFSSVRAVQAMRRAVRPDGLVAVNIVSQYYGRFSDIIRRQVVAYAEVFKHVAVFAADRNLSGWQAQNLILMASDKPLPLRAYRFEPLPPLDTSRDVPPPDTYMRM